MQKFQDVVLDQYGNVVQFASVIIYNHGTLVRPTIYSDNGSTIAANPLTTDDLGRYYYYAAAGRYDHAISGSKITSYTETDVVLQDSNADLASTASPTLGAGLSGFSHANAYGQSTVGLALNAFINVKNAPYNAVGDGTTDDTSAVIAAIAALSSGGTLYFPRGTYLITSTLTIATSAVELVGEGITATTLKYVPTANGTLLSFTKGASIIQYCAVRRMQLYSTDSTYTKTAIKISDGDTTTIEDVLINGSVVANSTTFWSGANSIGIQSNGRQLGSFKNVTVAADKPLVIADNPNSTIDIDHYHFTDMYLLGNGNPLITINTGVNLSNVTFDGVQAWVLGTDGLYWVDTTTVGISHNLSLQNIRREQSTVAASYLARIEHNYTMQSFEIKNTYADPTCRGIYLRKVVDVNLDSFAYPNSSGITFDVDSTVKRIKARNCYWQTNSTANIAGQRLLWSGPKTFSGDPLPPDFIYDESTNTTNIPLTGAAQEGIKFNATQVASADPNTLDDYEEGTWTPVVSFGGASVGVTYTTQTGSYTKKGREVTATCRIVLSSKGSSVGNAAITGLPFTTANNPACVIDCSTGMLGLTSTVFGAISGTSITPVQQGATARTPLADTNFNNTADIRFGITYEV